MTGFSGKAGRGRPEESLGRVPVDARIGDRLAVGELREILRNLLFPPTRLLSSIAPMMAVLPPVRCSMIDSKTAGICW